MQDYRQFDAEQKALGTSELEAAARWWDLLAENERGRLRWDPSADPSGIDSRATMYRRTAESLRVQERTGQAVCSCCFKPTGSGQCEYSRRRY